MTRQEFIRIARDMRALQKQWFNTRPADRPPDLLGKAKDSEKRFDQALDDLAYYQRGLFDGENEDSSR